MRGRTVAFEENTGSDGDTKPVTVFYENLFANMTLEEAIKCRAELDALISKKAKPLRVRGIYSSKADWHQAHGRNPDGTEK